jgi:hypothetical protein
MRCDHHGIECERGLRRGVKKTHIYRALNHVIFLLHALNVYLRLMLVLMEHIVIKAIGNNEERKEITARRHKILTWKTLSNKER